MPLSRQIAACNRRWQLELPQRGAVSLSMQHHLQSSTSSDDIDATHTTQCMDTVGPSRMAGGDGCTSRVEAVTQHEREDRLVKMDEMDSTDCKR